MLATVTQNNVHVLIFFACTFAGIQFLQQYGWFLLLGLVAFLYVKNKYITPTVERIQQQREDEQYKKMGRFSLHVKFIFRVTTSNCAKNLQSTYLSGLGQHDLKWNVCVLSLLTTVFRPNKKNTCN